MRILCNVRVKMRPLAFAPKWFRGSTCSLALLLNLHQLDKWEAGFRTRRQNSIWPVGLANSQRPGFPAIKWSGSFRFFRMLWAYELPGGCSAGVLACECTGRPAFITPRVLLAFAQIA